MTGMHVREPRPCASPLRVEHSTHIYPTNQCNVFLHVYQYEYLGKLVNQDDIETAIIIAKTFRYQDDCIALNDNGVFAQHFHLIYPPEMILS